MMGVGQWEAGAIAGGLERTVRAWDRPLRVKSLVERNQGLWSFSVT